MLCYHNCLFNFWFNVPVNNFSVILRLSHRILGIDKLNMYLSRAEPDTSGSEPAPQGYKNNFKFSSAEHEISTAHKC